MLEQSIGNLTRVQGNIKFQLGAKVIKAHDKIHNTLVVCIL
ncbi:hypothetical protein CLV42_11277 [Chitinophaga ginsengisoli]|uniref:Uncharacterized protein n=1 Tax=Chitinophaga ginsengisoli TaxID=363837 RepID=A0A2P8FVX3_9BACT|nr:hypothetical protein CLV42_11277 [Chitinophaga ginsengisoli]